MDHSKFSFLCGCAGFVDLVYAAETFNALAKKDYEHANFFVLDGKEWSKFDFRAPWTAISMATFKPPKGDRIVVAISAQGGYWEVNTRTVEESSGVISQAVFPLRRLATINGKIYACGMGRSVLRRKNPGKWNEIGPGTSPKEEGLVVGFEDIGGFSAKEIYAVGWRGEIWNYNGRTWRQLDTPSSTNLNAMCCAADGQVYVVGDKGTMLRGRGDTWETLKLDRHENLMDVASFGNSVYVVSDFEILKLQGDTLIKEEAFSKPKDRPATCLHLLECDDGLISMGPKDVFRLQEGTWERIV